MASMKQQGLSARGMARALSCSPSTITRELARNTLTEMPYGSHTARGRQTRRQVCVRRRGLGRGAHDAGLEVVAPANCRYHQPAFLDDHDGCSPGVDDAEPTLAKCARTILAAIGVKLSSLRDTHHSRNLCVRGTRMSFGDWGSCQWY